MSCLASIIKMILITGCSGYIGSQIIYVLNKNKIKFIGVDNLKCSYRKILSLKIIFIVRYIW